MRRLLSTLLLIVLGLGPTIAAVPANAFTDGVLEGLRAGIAGQLNDSQLPACCRRNGKHHCALSTQTYSRLGAHGETTIAANDCCPCPPQSAVATAPSIAAIVLSTNTSIASLSEFRILQTIPAQARLTDQRSHPKRGPPATQTL